ncbi:MAG TPA: hypothetical protein DCZ97_11870 [Syntrophus sp. (in: bacteria)]|nr:hypothetical protein [Syntrophus sp. (in: bacteria)]
MVRHERGSAWDRSSLLTAPLVEIKIQPLSFLSARMFPDSNAKPPTLVPGDILRERRGEDSA